jgi:hypothetical protein
MQELILSNLKKAIHDIAHEGQDLGFTHPASFLEDGAEIAFIAKLSNDVAMRGVSDDIEALENVGMLQLGERLNLAVQHLTADGIAHAPHIDGLYRHCLIYVG